MLSIRCNSHVKLRIIRKRKEKDDWKKFQKNNVKIDLNVLHDKKEKISAAYVSKHNSNREKQVILLMIPNVEKQWHYLAVKMLCENKDFCNLIMPSKDTRILEFNQYQKSDKATFITYADLKWIIE